MKKQGPLHHKPEAEQDCDPTAREDSSNFIADLTRRALGCRAEKLEALARSCLAAAASDMKDLAISQKARKDII